MNLAKAISDIFDRMFAERMFLATVTDVSGDQVEIQRSDSAAADVQTYSALASYATPTATDEVLVVRVGGGLLVVGKVVR